MRTLLAAAVAAAASPMPPLALPMAHQPPRFPTPGKRQRIAKRKRLAARGKA